MKLGTSVFLGATGLMCLGLTGVMTVAACGSSSNGGGSSSSGSSSGTTSSSSSGTGSSSSGTSSSSGSSGGSSSGPGTVPPTKPTGPVTTQTAPHNFAMHALHLGDETDPTTSTADWPKYGYNIDGLVTTATSTNVCTQFADSPKPNQADGPGGVDNSFGKNIVPLLVAVSPDPSATLTTSLQAGGFTLMMDVTGIDTSAAGTTQTNTGLTGLLFGGVYFGQAPNADGGTPTFTTADNWPLSTSFVTSAIEDGGVLGTPLTSNVTFGSPYIVNGTFVSGAGTKVTLALTLSGVPLSIPISDAVITFTNNGPTKPNATGGIISGVILVSDLVSALTPVAGNISTSFCSLADGGPSPGFAQIISAIDQAADIMHDGTNAAGTPCDAISIGIGFDADEIGLPQVVGQNSTGANKCDTGDGG